MLWPYTVHFVWHALKMEGQATATVDNSEAQSPEIVIGLVAPYGTPLTYFTTTLSGMLLSKCGYSTEVLRLSEYTKLFAGLSEAYPPVNASEYARVAALMTRGDRARELANSPDVLALCAIKDIHDRRSGQDAILTKQAFVLRQLKRPEEVYTLRQVYGDGFHLVGLYCPRDERQRRHDHRDHKRGIDSNDELKRELLLETLAATVQGWDDLNTTQRTSLYEQTRSRLKGSRLSSLTEFVRAVHAEMDAILSASRNGVSVHRASLYCTTFPCHNCAKHIVGAGIKRVVYIEPYPKSLSSRLHDDSISLDRREANKVTFAAFVGVAPRRYADLFSMKTSAGIVLQRKDDDGKLIENRVAELRLRMPHFSMFGQERKAAEKLTEKISKETL